VKFFFIYLFQEIISQKLILYKQILTNIQDAL